MRIEERLRIVHMQGEETTNHLLVRDADTGYWHRDVDGAGGQVDADLDEVLDNLAANLPVKPVSGDLVPPTH